MSPKIFSTKNSKFNSFLTRFPNEKFVVLRILALWRRQKFGKLDKESRSSATFVSNLVLFYSGCSKLIPINSLIHTVNQEMCPVMTQNYNITAYVSYEKIHKTLKYAIFWHNFRKYNLWLCGKCEITIRVCKAAIWQRTYAQFLRCFAYFVTL